MQPIVTALPSAVPAANPLSPDSSPFDASPHSPTSATISSDLSSSLRANRPTGQHNLRGIRAVVEEQRLYQWRDATPGSGTAAAEGTGTATGERAEGGDGRVKSVGVGSTLWQRRQRLLSGQQQRQPPRGQADGCGAV